MKASLEIRAESADALGCQHLDDVWLEGSLRPFVLLKLYRFGPRLLCLFEAPNAGARRGGGVCSARNRRTTFRPKWPPAIRMPKFDGIPDNISATARFDTSSARRDADDRCALQCHPKSAVRSSDDGRQTGLLGGAGNSGLSDLAVQLVCYISIGRARASSNDLEFVDLLAADPATGEEGLDRRELHDLLSQRHHD